MGCIRFSVLSAGHMGSGTGRGGPTASRFSPSLKAIRAVQVSGAESQAGGHIKVSGNFYEVLGLSKGATAQDIKRAYRKLARRFHPDAASSGTEKSLSTEMFLKIKTAYSVLSQPDDRAQYDRQLIVEQGLNWKRVPGRAGSEAPSGHMGRNWETDQCW